MDKLTISTAAKQAGVGVETIRYYQRIGLILEPAKPASGYRTYTDQNVQQIQFIQRAKKLGFSLVEIKTLLSLGEGSCDQTKQLASSKLDDVKGKIKDLRAIASTLETLISSCEDNSSNSSCPIIDAISQGK
ncbi:MerR family transcriptional regulator [Pontibacterium sp.]|uniref:MerR family transcriptional regulator n=1 Tax=Pontibacterium sp. TaxID=2036026 RepID=UPI003566F44E